VQENWPHLWDRASILALAERKLGDLHARGIRTIVDLTTVDLGRDIGLIAEVARRCPVHVIVATGVPISTHTWAAGRSGEAQQAIFAQEGVDLGRVIIGHSGDSDDLGYLRGLMDRGSTIGMDRFGLEHFLPTAKRVEVIARLCAEGYAGKMVLSHDANCWTDMLSEDDKRRTRPRWHYNHIPDDILPALRQAGVTEDQIEQMLVRNPRAIFEGDRS
jgi:predicted metal-dependent phosphotriesterase family hydrolase